MSNYEKKAMAGEIPTAKDVLELFADEKNWLGYYPPDLKPRAKVWAWVGPVVPPWEAAQTGLYQ